MDEQKRSAPTGTDGPDTLNTDRKYRRGRAAIVFGLAGTVISAVALYFVRLNDIVFVWGRTGYFFSYLPVCVFAFAAFVGAFVCRKRCSHHNRPKRETGFYAALSAVSAVIIMGILLFDQTQLIPGDDIRSDVEIRAGEPIVIIETTLDTTPGNSVISLYRDYGLYAKQLAAVYGERYELISAGPDKYTIRYDHISDDTGEICRLSYDFTY